MKPHALVVQKTKARIPISAATLCAKLITPSAMTQLTGGLPGVAFSLASRSLNGAALCSVVDRQSAAMSCVTSSLSDCGRPSGTASKRKPSVPARESLPRDWSRRRWLYSELTLVQHRRDVALRRLRDEHGVRLLLRLSGAHRRFAWSCTDRRGDGWSECSRSQMIRTCCSCSWMQDSRRLVCVTDG